MQVLSPDILQLYIQQLQQQASGGGGGGGGGGGSMGEAAEGEDSHMQTTATLLQQVGLLHGSSQSDSRLYLLTAQLKVFRLHVLLWIMEYNYIILSHRT